MGWCDPTAQIILRQYKNYSFFICSCRVCVRIVQKAIDFISWQYILIKHTGIKIHWHRRFITAFLLQGNSLTRNNLSQYFCGYASYSKDLLPNTDFCVQSIAKNNRTNVFVKVPSNGKCLLCVNTMHRASAYILIKLLKCFIWCLHIQLALVERVFCITANEKFKKVWRRHLSCN